MTTLRWSSLLCRGLLQSVGSTWHLALTSASFSFPFVALLRTLLVVLDLNSVSEACATAAAAPASAGPMMAL